MLQQVDVIATQDQYALMQVNSPSHVKDFWHPPLLFSGVNVSDLWEAEIGSVLLDVPGD